jgi:hypothetical protein
MGIHTHPTLHYGFCLKTLDQHGTKTMLLYNLPVATQAILQK